MHLARGDIAAAAASIRDALERPTWVPSKELPPATELQRAPLLAVQVEIAIADGDIDAAQAAADELDSRRHPLPEQGAGRVRAHGRARVRLALGDSRGAERLFSEAAELWNEVGAPYETALARIGLGDACRASGHEHRAELEHGAARAIIDQIRTPPAAGATAPASQVGPTLTERMPTTRSGASATTGQ